jgi:hypothetical protein
MKKNRGHEPIGVIIHIYIGNSLCSYLYLQQKCHIFFFLFSSTKSENRRGEQVLPGLGGRGNSGRERVNMVQICVLMYVNGKMRPVETIPGMGGGIKKNDGGCEFNYDIL